MVMPTPRQLTAGEAAILAVIGEQFGPRNTAEEVFFTDEDKAALFIKASDGTAVAGANLTNLAKWRADGTITSDQELKTKWLPTI
jgi:hypothetical protein